MYIKRRTAIRLKYLFSSGHGLLKKFWPFGNRLRSTHCREFLYMKLCRPAYFVRTTQSLPHPGHE